MAPLMNGRLPSSLVCDGSEPRLVSYFSQMRVLCIACGKNHMLAITDNGVSVADCLWLLLFNVCTFTLYLVSVVF